VALTDAAGVVTDSYEFDAFGTVVARVGSSANPILYSGEWIDAGLGLQYLRARWYQPGAGRFETSDPLRSHPKPDLQAYVYANGDGINGRDPSGYLTTVVIWDALASSWGSSWGHASTVINGANWNFTSDGFYPDVTTDFDWRGRVEYDLAISSAQESTLTAFFQGYEALVDKGGAQYDATGNNCTAPIQLGLIYLGYELPETTYPSELGQSLDDFSYLVRAKRTIVSTDPRDAGQDVGFGTILRIIVSFISVDSIDTVVPL
jgi:RHS repeat-associated protein